MPIPERTAVLLACDYARTIEHAVRYGETAADCAAPAQHEPEFGGVFVTLHKLGRLRGCMGLLEPQESLTAAVRRAAVCAALQDPRFHPVTLAELPAVEIEVSVMSRPQPLRPAAARTRQHGIIVSRGRRGLFLPQVATEYGFSRNSFRGCCSNRLAGGCLATAYQCSSSTDVFAELSFVRHSPRSGKMI